VQQDTALRQDRAPLYTTDVRVFEYLPVGSGVVPLHSPGSVMIVGSAKCAMKKLIRCPSRAQQYL
jgi:hypothetical protein